ncbi:MAG: Regulatory protein [Candidatus Bathyarchaeota archaeon BA1]|nr:MAG: Regulatory protein [Candidatus Bathyarchaeota archaeon BA1]
MIKKLEDFNKYLAIAGFRDVKIEDIGGFFDLVRRKVGDAYVQFFDARLIAGWEHLYFAALNALNAFKNRQNISNNLAVEALLFASAQRQIRRAVEILGINPTSSRIAVLIIAETQQKATATLETISEVISGERDDSVLELADEKLEGIKKLFGVSDIELKAGRSLMDLVIEHIALLATIK